MTDQAIVSEINQWISNLFPNDIRRNWYVGIARDAKDCLFNRHSVHPKNGYWIHRSAVNTEHARSAESILLRMGYDGGPSGGDNSTIHVYAFRKDLGTVR